MFHTYLFLDLRQAFDAFDHDGKGQIESADVAMVMRSLGISFDSTELQKMIRRASRGCMNSYGTVF